MSFEAACRSRSQSSPTPPGRRPPLDLYIASNAQEASSVAPSSPWAPASSTTRASVCRSTSTGAMSSTAQFGGNIYAVVEA